MLASEEVLSTDDEQTSDAETDSDVEEKVRIRTFHLNCAQINLFETIHIFNVVNLDRARFSQQGKIIELNK